MTLKAIRLLFATQVRTSPFLWSEFMFNAGLFFVTFEQIRPYGVMPSDSCFFVSLLLLLFCTKVRLLQSTGSGVLMGGALVLSGALLSLQNASNLNHSMTPLARLFVLFGLFAPLAVIHSKDVRKSLLFLVCGIGVNCAITALQAWVFPGIVDMLSVNPVASDTSDIGRFQGLTGHTVTLGFSAALGVLIGIQLASFERNRLARWGLIFLSFLCALGALLSGSRTFLASLMPAVIVFVLLQRMRRGVAVRAVVALLIVWGALTYFAPGAITDYSDRVGTAGVMDYGRLLTAATALEEISQKPILGWGVDHFEDAGATFIPEVGDFMGVHNSFLAYWNSIGLLAALGFLTFFIVPTRKILRLFNEKLSVDSMNVLRMILAILVFLFIVSNLGPYIYSRFLYIPLFVLAGFVAHLPATFKAHKIARQPVVQLKTPNIATIS